MDQRHVKGTMLADFVRMIRANKDQNWDTYLEEGDWEIINSKIYPTQWYPLGYYQRLGFATFKVLAGGDLETVRMSGRMRGREFFSKVYSSAIAVQDPARALSHFVKIYSSLFDFAVITYEQTGPKQVENERYQLHDPFPDSSAGPDTMVRPRGYERQRTESRQAIENTMPDGIRGGRAVPGGTFGPPGQIIPPGASNPSSWQYPETVPY